MSEREKFEAGMEARHAVLHDAGHEDAVGDRMDALLRYAKGSVEGRSGGAGRAEPLADHEIRRRVIDCVLDVGGVVTAAFVAAGSVWLRARVGCRSEIALLERNLRAIPGVTRLDTRVKYDIDDTVPRVPAEGNLR